jgi:hypothetical protein
MYSSPSVYELSVCDFSLMRDAQINSHFQFVSQFSLYTSSCVSQTKCCSLAPLLGCCRFLIFLNVQNITAMTSGLRRSSSMTASHIVVVTLL